MTGKQNLRRTGEEYERKAEAYLRQQGYRILERNYHCRRGEIDLIAAEGEMIVFCEVKYRSRISAGHPLEAVHPKKQQNMICSARVYLMQKGYTDASCRFDVIGFLGEELIHVPNAFTVDA